MHYDDEHHSRHMVVTPDATAVPTLPTAIGRTPDGHGRGGRVMANPKFLGLGCGFWVCGAVFVVVGVWGS